MNIATKFFFLLSKTNMTADEALHVCPIDLDKVYQIIALVDATKDECISEDAFDILDTDDATSPWGE